MSKLGDPRHRHDAFFRKARGAGFAARSVYKLEEIDRKLRLLRPGDRVLDLGCRPGSWMQYAQKVVGRTAPWWGSIAIRCRSPSQKRACSAPTS